MSDKQTTDDKVLHGPTTIPQVVTSGGGPGRRIVPATPSRQFDSYGEVTPDGAVLRDILKELRAIRSLLENQNGE